MPPIPPDRMVPVSQFAKARGMTVDDVVDMIREGSYVGRKIGDDWYIDEQADTETNPETHNIKNLLSGLFSQAIRIMLLLLLAIFSASFVFYFFDQVQMQREHVDTIANTYASAIIGLCFSVLFAYLFYKLNKSSVLKLDTHKFSEEADDLLNSVHEKLESISKEAEAKEKEKQRQYAYLQTLRSDSGHEPIVSTYVGGTGFPLEKGKATLVTLRGKYLCLSNIENEETIKVPFSDIISIEISGPGKQTSDLGLIGGGFGIEGAAKGILIASVINALTTKSEINTYLRVGTFKGEVILHVTTIEPSELRSILSPIFVKVNTLQHSSSHDLTQELEKLHQMFLNGALTELEFKQAKENVLSKK